MADSPFVWGAGGSQMTPGQIAAQRKVAQALIAQGNDYSPVAHWTQGMARVANALVGNLQAGNADEADRANMNAERALILSALGGAGAVPSTPAAATPAAGMPVATSQPAAPVRVASLGPNIPASAMLRPEVQPTSRVWGDKEAEAAGLYETPAAKVAAAVPPTQVAQATTPGAQAVSQAINPALVQMATSPYVSDGTRQMGMQLLSARMKPRDQWVDERDPASGSYYQRNVTTGERKVIEKSDVLPQAAVDQRVAIASAGKPNTTINNTVNPILKGVGDRFNEDMDVARASVPQIQGIFEARKALDQGAITGAAADPKLFLSKAANLFGLGSEAAANTEVLRSSVGNSVLAKAKSLGANPSNADRDYIEKVMGGSIALEESSMRRLLDIQEKWAREAIQRANKQGQRMLEAQPAELRNVGGLLSVEEPPAYADFLKANPVTPSQPSRGDIEGEMRRRGLLK